jgi:eukaryotic-like serine/threonine-protein kinase
MYEGFKKSNSEAGYKTSKRIVTPVRKRDKSVSHPAFKALIIFNILGAMVAGYLYFNRDENPAVPVASNEIAIENGTAETSSMVKQVNQPADPEEEKKPVVKSAPVIKKDTTAVAKQETKRPDPVIPPVTVTRTPEKPVPTANHAEKNPQSSKVSETITYTVAGPQVYFHNKPDERTRRNAFINRWNKAVLKPLDEENGFVYIVYTNKWGQTSKGWMLKKQLTPLNHQN